MPPPAELLAELRAAFVASRHHPSSTTYASSGRTFAKLFDDELARRLSVDELAALFAHGNHREAGLAAARSGRLPEARRELDVARAALHSPRLSEEARVVATALLEPAEAYLEYRLEQYDDARALLVHASGLDGALVRDHGYVFMSAHRLQIAHNLLRIHRRLDERQAAVELAGVFLDYIELGEDRIPSSLASPRRCLEAVPGDVLEFYFEVMVAEIAPLLACRIDNHARVLFQPLASHSVRSDCRRTHFARQAHDWLAMKSFALERATTAAVAAATRVIRRGRRVHPFLWFTALREASELCEELGSEGAATAAWLAAESARLDDAPSPHRARELGHRGHRPVDVGALVE